MPPEHRPHQFLLPVRRKIVHFHPLYLPTTSIDYFSFFRKTGEFMLNRAFLFIFILFHRASSLFRTSFPVFFFCRPFFESLQSHRKSLSFIFNSLRTNFSWSNKSNEFGSIRLFDLGFDYSKDVFKLK